MGWFAEEIKEFFSSAIDDAMKAIWEAGLYLLRFVFGLIDELSAFELSADEAGNPVSGPVSLVWGDLKGLSVVIALGLFFWQLTSAVLRGGRGFWRASTGPFAYAVALGMTVAVVGGLLAAADYTAVSMLQKGLQSGEFSAAFDRSVGDEKFRQGVNGVVLGILAVVGVIPAGLGYLLEMIFRQGAILVLVATVPITAAGLLAQTTASWFWRSLRWMIAAIMMKPALALTLVIGVNMVQDPQEGILGLLVGIGVLLIALTCPFVLFRLLAFVDPNSDAGSALRGWFAQNVADAGYSGGGASTSGGGGSMEAANSARFDQATASYASASMTDAGVGSPSPGYSRAADGEDDGSSTSSSPNRSSDTAPGSPDSSASSGGPTDAAAPLPSSGGGGTGGAGGEPGGGAGYGDPPPPEHPNGNDSGGGGRGPGGGGGGGGAAGTAEEAAVIL
ncbi:hypothetical protein [Pseudonocardia sp. H11422]|uniref:hypothetical protein n=1 Tax=Pseudonocardia sp. H11422 TaxID=2835866 RepID=UPI001BDC7C06|nr:hypothetical protein [Pseudonocardia sp. H11422]